MSELSTAVRLPLIDERQGPSGQPFTLKSLERRLAEQQALSAVDTFAQIHDAGEHDAQAPYYRALLPASSPGEGEQYAFEVDLDACTGCKACVTACHSLNGLDEGETFRSVGFLHGGTPEAPVVQTVTTACHHCLDPACMKGCPVGAYEKDAKTGIVKHLDDQCIGCRYCTLTCPYEVPKFNERLGIVRKCDMCSDRLAVGEAPACVQACPSGAISIRIVRSEQVIEDAQADVFLPGAPSPGITMPTTSYRSKRPLPRNTLPADFYAVRPAHNEGPLVWLLVLTQLSVGAFCVEQILARLAPGAHSPLHAAVALVLGLIALHASLLHVGRPLYAFRAILGIRTSWMSREIAAFGAYAALASAYAALTALSRGWLSFVVGVVPAWLSEGSQLTPVLGLVVCGVGLVAVFCSVMLYAVTGRRWWSVPRTFARFYATAALLGTVTSLIVSLTSAALSDGQVDASVAVTTRYLAVALVVIATLKLLGEALDLLHLRDVQRGDLRRSAELLAGRMHRATFFRYLAGVAGGVIVPIVFLTRVGVGPASGPLTAAVVSGALVVVGELIERTTFFTAASAPRMPGANR